MKFVIPIYITVEAASPHHAEATRQTIERLITQGAAPMFLSSAGISYTGIVVAGAHPVPAPPISD